MLSPMDLMEIESELTRTAARERLAMMSSSSELSRKESDYRRRKLEKLAVRVAAARSDAEAEDRRRMAARLRMLDE